jgi:TolA-binding protein
MMSTTRTPTLIITAAAALLLIISVLSPQHQVFTALASQHVRSRMPRLLDNKDISHALFQPEKESIINVDSTRNCAMMSHMQSRLQRSNNRIEQMIGSLNQTSERLQLHQQQDQQLPLVTSSVHHAYILPHTAS